MTPRLIRSLPLILGGACLCLAALPAAAGDSKPRRNRPARPNALVVGRDQQLEQVATGYQFTEGPAVDAEGNVFFSDSPQDRILVVPVGGSPRVWRQGSRSANGMLFDKEGRLITCNSQLAPGGRTVTRYEKDGTVKVLAERYNGKPFNSPNDLAIDKDGRIYFTDPRYGEMNDVEQDKQAVYRIEKDGKITRVISDLETPNGILITPDGKTLYVAVNNPAPGGALTLVAYDIDGKRRVTRRKVLYDLGSGRGFDGMALDKQGNIYATGGAGEKSGVYVISPEGRLIQVIKTPEDATNCTFGGPDLRVLYVTAGKSLYRIRTRIAGSLVFPSPGQAARRSDDDSILTLPDPTVPPGAPRIVASAQDAGGYAAFPDITRTADGELLCVFYAGYGHVSNPKDGWEWGGKIMQTRSRDEGKTWSRPTMVIDTPHDDRDPHVNTLSDGRVILTWFSTWDPKDTPRREKHPHGLFMATSLDGGRFWSPPQRIEIDSPRSWISSAPVRELKDGKLILGLYTMDKATGNAWGGSIRSRDGGKTWGELAEIGASAGLPLDAETDLIQLRDGRLLAALRSSKVNMHWAWSRDEGLSWSEPRDAGFKAHAPAFLRLRNRAILMGHRIPNTAVHWSEDEGETWSGPLQIDSVTGAYPGFVQLRDGDIFCVYYEEGAGSNIRGRRLKWSKDGLSLATDEP